MIKRVLFLPDFHKLEVDPHKQPGLVHAQKKIFREVIDVCKTNKVNIVVIGGDYYDRGYRSPSNNLFEQLAEDTELAQVVDEVDYVRGNHAYHGESTHPELFMQHSPIFNFIPRRRLGKVELLYHHLISNNYDYETLRPSEGVEKTIGVFHDTDSIPQLGKVSMDTVLRITKYCDIVITNHIHSPFSDYEINGKHFWHSGALTNIGAQTEQIRDVCNLNLLEINEETGEINRLICPIKLHDASVYREAKERQKQNYSKVVEGFVKPLKVDKKKLLLEEQRASVLLGDDYVGTFRDYAIGTGLSNSVLALFTNVVNYTPGDDIRQTIEEVIDIYRNKKDKEEEI